jgi:hypothetical protein
MPSQQRSSGQSYAFLFYGADPVVEPSDAREDYSYEVRFLSTPGPAIRYALADVFREQLRLADARPSRRTWLWSGPWLKMRVAPRRRDEGAVPFFPAMPDLFLAVHRVVPVAEVVFLDAGDAWKPTDRWDEWTLNQQPVPTPGPAYPGCVRTSFRQATDPSLPAPTADADFEAALHTR